MRFINCRERYCKRYIYNMINKHLKKIYSLLKKRQRLVLILLITLLILSMYLRYLIIIIFILLAGLSKFYHRFFKSSLGISLVLFTTIMTMLVYKNIILGLTVAWLGLLLADFVGNKLSYTSLVSIFILSFIVLISQFFVNLPLITTYIILTIIFEILSIILYYLIGSSPQKIIIYLVSHLSFNLFLILTFAEKIKEIIIYI